MKVYESLANAIIERAADDYKTALRDLRKLEIQISDLERFFCSQYFECLTKVNGPALMDKLRRVVESEQKKKD